MEENIKDQKINQVKVVKKKKKKKKKKVKKEKFINPYKTTWGKIIIWILCSAMVLGTFASLIYLVVKEIMRA